MKVDEVRAGLLPAEKAEWLATRRATCFVGDGINDAPALAKARVGIAVGSATDVTAEAGDIVAMGEPLSHLPLLYRLSREMVKVIHQNIVWFAFGVNIVGILLTGWLWPIFAPSPEWYERAPLVGVMYHQLGSLAVLLNSMRLLGFERTTKNATVKRVPRRAKGLRSMARLAAIRRFSALAVASLEAGRHHCVIDCRGVLRRERLDGDSHGRSGHCPAFWPGRRRPGTGIASALALSD